MKEIGPEGVREARPGSTGQGLSSAERTEMYRTEAITSGSGYRRMYGETTNLWRKPLYLRNASLNSVMAREECGAIRLGNLPAWEARIDPCLGETYSFSSLSRCRQG